MEGRRNVQGLALRAAAACALLAALGGCATLRGEAAIGAGYRLLVEAHDRDGDGALDAGEVEAMIDRAVPAERRGAGWDRLRTWLVERWIEQDREGDGRLTPGELAAGPRAAFDCLDRDGDGRLGRGEVGAGWGLCLADNM